MTQTPSETFAHDDLHSNRTGDDARIQIKGRRDGLSIILGDGDWHELVLALDQRLQQSAAFFQDCQVHLNIGQRHVSAEQLRELFQVLQENQVTLARLHTASRASADAAQELDIRLGLPEAVQAPPELPLGTEQWSEGLLFHRTLRSGQALRHPGHVIVIGDVNPGAEVIAGGDVVVWGRVRGMVHAGAAGNDRAIVCALELRPTQLRIGSYIATSPEELARATAGPEMACALEGRIVAKPWLSK